MPYDNLIVLHLGTVLSAVLIGTYRLVRQKGTPGHKMLGKVYLTLMGITGMLGLYIGGILIAGTLAFAPGRMLHRWLMGLFA